ncbi:XRE family transcriptional regulator [Mucilaginibacter conchicola]|uniref:XRE family transcriptional regulator n=1 Tax=Mucilaginibacter conchicola TaxID=2303333 RepID=A0A372NZA8_9SPHI|nr:helix-turn-helix transcriptional regulator [Mucilaginibacter conchicola]RFZ95450.1 XRE family transcriptional regulator [Mucilaginibacter conchicola]
MKNSIKNRVNEIVTNIRLARERRNYTQDYLAMRMNVSQNAYSKIELGYSKLTLARLMEICNILEIPIAEMVEPCQKQISYRLVYNPALQAI